METSKAKRVETRDEAIDRLAIEAKRKGIMIFRYPMANEYYATSSSNPECLHRVTLLSCDCAGFFAHGRCTHHLALLEYIGELPELEPEPLTPEHLPAVLQARVAAQRQRDIHYPSYGMCLRRRIEADMPAAQVA
jgi:hypothetical protein